MKNVILIISVFIIVASCSNKKTLSVEKTVSTSESNVFEVENNNISNNDTLKQHFIPRIQGVWVLTDYINDIEKTKSPLKSWDKLEGIVTMIIDVENQSDSIEVGISWNNHEGDNFMLYFQTGQKENSLKTNIINYDEKSNFYELGYETISNITYLFLYHYDKTNLFIEKTQFSKVADGQQDDDLGWGLQYMVNRRLFSGSFTLVDSLNKTTKVKFNDDGSLMGFPEYKTYHIQTDYLGDPIYLDSDIILFWNEKRDITQYAFQIFKDTICLYSVIFHEEVGIPFELDELKYKLVRNK